MTIRIMKALNVGTGRRSRILRIEFRPISFRIPFWTWTEED